jgi:hypothetical protein
VDRSALIGRLRWGHVVAGVLALGVLAATAAMVALVLGHRVAEPPAAEPLPPAPASDDLIPLDPEPAAGLPVDLPGLRGTEVGEARAVLVDAGAVEVQTWSTPSDATVADDWTVCQVEELGTPEVPSGVVTMMAVAAGQRCP